MGAIISFCTQVLRRANMARMTPFYGHGKTNGVGDVALQMLRYFQLLWGALYPCSFPLHQCSSTKGRRRRKREHKAFTCEANSRATSVTSSFIREPICMLTPINFSWPSHGEHSQPEGANAKLICVLKLLS